MKPNESFVLRGLGAFLLLFLIHACGTERTSSSKITEFDTSPVDKVYTQLDTENSRWFLFSSACRPFGMVNLSPDTQIGGAWGSGYRHKTDTIKGFSHIHGWQISGLSVMPVTISEENGQTVFSDFYSKFSHNEEKTNPGYHKVFLQRYDITVELTSTKRVGFHKYSFPTKGKPALLFNLNGLLGPCENRNGTLTKIDDNVLTGEFEMAPTHRRPKPFQVFFQTEFDSKIDSIVQDDRTGNYLVFMEQNKKTVQLKAGISYTSIENAQKNSKTELDHWNFEKVVEESKEEWNNVLGRIKVSGGTETQRRRFYTDLWHALQGRRIINDVNGSYPDNTGDNLRVGHLPLGVDGKPEFNHYNSDSFWGAQWTLNTLWGLVYPDIKEEFVRSLLQYYNDGGLVPRGPSGGNYTYVMTGASSTPFIVSAIQKGIVRDSLESIYKALRKNHMPGGIMEKAGYEHTTNLGGGFKHYLEKGFVPYPIPEGKFGGHQDGASLTLEYAYQDWTLAQLAKKLNEQEDYGYFLDRSNNYKLLFDKESGWIRPKDSIGNWMENYDPYLYKNGFIESNGAQSTWFVPHDITGLAQLMGGLDRAVEKLNGQFKTAQKLDFTSGTSHDVEVHPEYSRVPINYGNQPSIQTAFIFNQLGRPDLTQYWSRKVVDSVFSGLDPSTGYNGDEDQGLMGSLAVLLKMGLFQMNGGTEEDPAYQLGSPIFDAVKIDLHPDYYPGTHFVIRTKNNDQGNWAIKNTFLNGKPIQENAIPHSQIVKGGELLIEFKEN
ncbi:GH92 family glycosyl hydrolase [Ulvibacterium sp.]|uniref:GH92 family glycosyl hydrolase n=1 Tax=Ulvibacterium sp. TaxID=2665914 RepID=UPI0026048F80|nr:GH92 family glycosyl hydrolase [Ulvibacterium sp.]